MRRLFVGVVFVIYIIIGVVVASGHHYFEHLDALKLSVSHGPRRENVIKQLGKKLRLMEGFRPLRAAASAGGKASTGSVCRDRADRRRMTGRGRGSQ
jgi:hypothetical protein